jgi:hypothetical protein
MPQDASVAILAIDNIEVDNHLIRASFGTTKYCSFFLRNTNCPNKECLYQHHLADDSDIIHRDDMNNNKNMFYDQQILAMNIAEIFNPEVRNKLTQPKKIKTIFPSKETIYMKDLIVLEDNKKNNGKKFQFDDCNYYDSNYSNEEVEYVLVQRKKFQNRKYYKSLKCKEIEKELSPERVTNTSDSSSNSNQNSNEKKCKKLYRRRDKSRFDFVSDNINIGNEVPDFIIDMLYRKISRFTFFKNFNIHDINFFEKELTFENSWAQFIKINIGQE